MCDGLIEGPYPKRHAGDVSSFVSFRLFLSVKTIAIKFLVVRADRILIFFFKQFVSQNGSVYIVAECWSQQLSV